MSEEKIIRALGNAECKLILKATSCSCYNMYCRTRRFRWRV